MTKAEEMHVIIKVMQVLEDNLPKEVPIFQMAEIIVKAAVQAGCPAKDLGHALVELYF